MRLRFGVKGDLNVLEMGDIPELHELEDILIHPGHARDLDTLEERLNERTWDLAVIEAQIDGLDSAEVVRCVKSRQPDCPVVMVVGVDDLGSVLRARKEGLDEYVVRAPSDDVFRGLLADALGRTLKRRHERTRRFEQDFWTFFDAAPIGMDILELDGTILHANPALEEFLGYSAQELQGRVFSDYTVEEERQEALDLVRALISGERTDYEHVSEHEQQYFVVDRRFRRKDGRICWANLVRLLIRDQQGSPRFVVGMMVDISERKRAKAALKESEGLKQAILNTAIDGIISMDERGVVQSFNKAAEEMFGFSRDEVIGEKINILMPSPYREEHAQYLERYLRTGERHIIGIGRDVEGQRKDGTIFPLNLGVGETEIDGNRLFTGVLRDLSEKKAMERQLHQAEKMQAVGQLAGGVAHDFNNVLMIVNSYSDLLSKRVEENSPLVPFIEKIQDAVWRGERLTRQLLAFSPEPTGETEIISLNDTIIEMEKFFGRVIEADIAVELDLSPELGVVLAEMGHIEQILMNLVLNARDAMPSGGHLTIRTCDKEVLRGQAPRRLRPGRYVILQVEDDGTGMSEETQARIFEPFYTTKAQDKGTGLGLATVYGIVHHYNGYVSVDSELGRGSCFTIYLPVAEAEQKHDVTDDEVRSPGDRVAEETILLVEDEDDIREPLRYTLEDGGYTVLTASNGVDALQVGRDHLETIDLLLTDVVLPGISGVELADELNEIYPKLKTIFISGYAGDILERKNLEPARVLISKPFAIDQLIHTVRQVLDG